MSDTGDKEPVDEQRSRLVHNFVQITGCGAVKARDFLEWCMRDIGAALLKYYARLDEVAGRPRSPYYELADSFMSELMREEQAAPTYPGRNKAKEEKSRTGAETVDPNKPSTSSTPRESFSGTGYRLGQSESDTQVVPSTSRSREDESHVTIKLWKEGFNVNDGPLREYDDPENKQFLDSVRQGLIPPELTNNIGNATVQLNLEDHHHESFTSFRAPKIRPFTGQGHVLGRRPEAPVERPEQKEQGQQTEPTSHEQLTETMEIDEPTETTVSSELTVSREPTDPTF